MDTESSLAEEQSITVTREGANKEKVYRVGTLEYTKWGLLSVFFWMLWGDFCLSLMELVIPKLLPLTLKDFGASNRLIGLLVGTIPAGMNMVITPVVSYRSDLHRSRLGRRIPFLLWPTPFITLFLITTGYADVIGRWLNASLLSHFGNFSTAGVVIVTIAISSVLFQYFNLYVTSVYYYLFNDVIPEQFMGRFYALFRLVGSAAGFIFNRYIFGWADTHRAEIYTYLGLIYLVGFTMMCWRVKEGEYPPPPPAEERKGLWKNIQIYFRECYTLRYYIWFYLSYALYAMSSVCLGTFGVFFAQKNLSMTLDAFGKVMSWTSVLALALYMPLGYISDRMHPLRLQLVGMILVPVISLAGFFLIHSPDSFLMWTILLSLGQTIYTAANGPLFPALLPAQKFGQFCSAASILSASAMMVAGYGGGAFIDWVNDYRYVYIWNAIFATFGLFFTLLVYRGWRRYGGPRHYVAPMPHSTHAETSL